MHVAALLMATLALALEAADTQLLHFQDDGQVAPVPKEPTAHACKDKRKVCPVFTPSGLVHAALVPGSPPPVRCPQPYSPSYNVGPCPSPRKPLCRSLKARTRHGPQPLAPLTLPRRAKLLCMNSVWAGQHWGGPEAKDPWVRKEQKECLAPQCQACREFVFLCKERGRWV